MGLAKISEHIQIKTKMPNPSQEPPAPNQDLKDIGFLCTFIINLDHQNLDHSPNQDFKGQCHFLE